MRLTVYEAPRDHLSDLIRELSRFGRKIEVRDPLVLVPGDPPPAAWAQNAWTDARFIPISSIGDGAKKLRDIQRNWALTSVGHHRRARLIQDKLPKIAAKNHVFGGPLPTAPLGAWTLWDENRILASPSCSSPFPRGEWRFAEDKTGPPNRAYLKLWEILSRINERPGPGQLCLDLGGSPGGWSYVLAGLGARVFSIDKAPLDPAIEANPLVQYCQGSAFGLEPAAAGAVDWLFSDVICYPDRLYAMLLRWLRFGECRRFACTVKLQGEADHAMLDRLAAIPGSRLVHLFHNKHELTWINCDAPLGYRPPEGEAPDETGEDAHAAGGQENHP